MKKVYVLAYVIVLVFQGLSMNAAGRSATPPGGAPLPVDLNKALFKAFTMNKPEEVPALVAEGARLNPADRGYVERQKPNLEHIKKYRDAFRALEMPVDLNKALFKAFTMNKPEEVPALVAEGARLNPADRGYVERQKSNLEHIKQYRDAYRALGMPVDLNKALYNAFLRDKPEEVPTLVAEGARLLDPADRGYVERQKSRMEHIKKYRDAYKALDESSGSAPATPPGGAPFLPPVAAGAGATPSSEASVSELDKRAVRAMDKGDLATLKNLVAQGADLEKLKKTAGSSSYSVKLKKYRDMLRFLELPVNLDEGLYKAIQDKSKEDILDLIKEGAKLNAKSQRWLRDIRSRSQLKENRDMLRLLGEPIDLDEALFMALENPEDFEDVPDLIAEGARLNKKSVDLLEKIKRDPSFITDAAHKKAWEEALQVIEASEGLLATPSGEAPLPPSAEPAVAAAVAAPTPAVGAGAPTPPTPPVITREQLERLRQLPPLPQPQ